MASDTMEDTDAGRWFRLQRRTSVVIKYALLLALIVIWMFPTYWMFTMSVKTPLEREQRPPTLFPSEWTGENYRYLFEVRGFQRYAANSIVVAAASTGIALLVGALFAYALARFTYPLNLNYYLLFAVLILRMFPPIVTIIPVFVIFLNLRIIDTVWALIIANVYLQLPFVIWMMKGFFQDIPVEMEEAALVDGDSRLTALWRIVLPLAAPGLVATAILTVIFSWNEYLFPLILSESKAVTLPVAASTLVQQFSILWGPMTAAGSLFTIPVLIFALIVQKHLVKGLTLGGVKA
jgi:multiple sugar transport system permease protein